MEAGPVVDESDRPSIPPDVGTPTAGGWAPWSSASAPESESFRLWWCRIERVV